MFTENHIPNETNKLRMKPIPSLAQILNCLNVVHRVCKIMVTLGLDFWLMLCIREEGALKSVYVNKFVGTKQLRTKYGSRETF